MSVPADPTAGDEPSQGSTLEPAESPAMFRSRRRSLLFAVVGLGVVLVAAAAAAIWWWVASSPSLPPLTQDQAAELTADLRSGQLERVRESMALPAGQAVDPAAIASLASLEITIDAVTFQEGDDGTASVNGTVRRADGTRERAVFYLVHVDGRWMMVGGLPAE